MSKNIRPPRGERRAEAKRAHNTGSFTDFWRFANDDALNAEHQRNRLAAVRVGGQGNRATRRGSDQ
jgi:hypothetical protein